MDFKVSDVNNLDIKYGRDSQFGNGYFRYKNQRDFLNSETRSRKSFFEGKTKIFLWKINGIKISSKKFVYWSDIEKLLKKFNHQITKYTFETLIDLKNYEKNYPSDILKTDYKNLTLTYNLEWK